MNVSEIQTPWPSPFTTCWHWRGCFSSSGSLQPHHGNSLHWNQQAHSQQHTARRSEDVHRQHVVLYLKPALLISFSWLYSGLKYKYYNKIRKLIFSSNSNLNKFKCSNCRGFHNGSATTYVQENTSSHFGYKTKRKKSGGRALTLNNLVLVFLK